MQLWKSVRVHIVSTFPENVFWQSPFLKSLHNSQWTTLSLFFIWNITIKDIYLFQAIVSSLVAYILCFANCDFLWYIWKKALIHFKLSFTLNLIVLYVFAYFICTAYLKQPMFIWFSFFIPVYMFLFWDTVPCGRKKENVISSFLFIF